MSFNIGYFYNHKKQQYLNDELFDLLQNKIFTSEKIQEFEKLATFKLKNPNLNFL